MAYGKDGTLSDHHKEWLYVHYCEGKTPQDIAALFGTSVRDFHDVKISPAGIQYADTLVFDRRNSLNLAAAELLLERMQNQGAVIPLEILVKIYSASLPKAAPVGFQISIEALKKEAEDVADKYNLDDESKKTLLNFIEKRDQRNVS